MKLRTRHLVCMMLLLSALRAADGSVLPAEHYGFSGHYIGVLLSQDHTGVWTKVTVHDHARNWGSGGFLAADLTEKLGHTFEAASNASLAAYRTTWTMRPPAAHCAALYAATSSAA
jgi:hypothetical protein